MTAHGPQNLLVVFVPVQKEPKQEISLAVTAIQGRLVKAEHINALKGSGRLGPQQQVEIPAFVRRDLNNEPFHALRNIQGSAKSNSVIGSVTRQEHQERWGIGTQSYLQTVHAPTKQKTAVSTVLVV
jgi:hypothetical protein